MFNFYPENLTEGLDYDYAYSIQILNTEEGRDKLRKIVELLTK